MLEGGGDVIKSAGVRDDSAGGSSALTEVSRHIFADVLDQTVKQYSSLHSAVFKVLTIIFLLPNLLPCSYGGGGGGNTTHDVRLRFYLALKFATSINNEDLI